VNRTAYAASAAGAWFALATMRLEPITVVSHRAATFPSGTCRSCFGPIRNGRFGFRQPGLEKRPLLVEPSGTAPESMCIQ